MPVLNTAGSIADSTIANLFLIKGGTIITPSLEEGCVKGVMRRHLLTELPMAGWKTLEMPVSVSEIKNADEIFLTNAINGIRWVKQFRDNVYVNTQTVEIYNHLIKTIAT